MQDNAIVPTPQDDAGASYGASSSPHPLDTLTSCLLPGRRLTAAQLEARTSPSLAALAMQEGWVVPTGHLLRGEPMYALGDVEEE